MYTKLNYRTKIAASSLLEDVLMGRNSALFGEVYAWRAKNYFAFYSLCDMGGVIFHISVLKSPGCYEK